MAAVDRVKTIFSQNTQKNCFQLQIYSKGNRTFLITKDFELYVWGKNNNGQLGLGTTKSSYPPTLLTINQKPFKVFSGPSHNYCLTENNLCYVWGGNNGGQIGLGDKNNRLSPTLFPLPNNEKISFISCGANHTICLTENNVYYVWGLNNSGQLGLGDTTTRLIPTLFHLPKKELITFIVCGNFHVICLTNNNLCYVWGENSSGQLGLGDTTYRPIPTLLTLSNSEKASFVTCGGNFTTCLTENKLCYVWGKNRSGELGLGDASYRSIPTLLSLPNNEKISFITCGVNHTMCLTENNLCYVWGFNNYGQLGLGNKRNHYTPTLFSLPNNERISFITCGSNHSICLTENNLCYVWGNNIDGQLGFVGNNTHYDIPCLFEFNPKKILA